MPSRGDGVEKKKTTAIAKAPLISKAVSILGRNLGGRGSAQRLTGATLGHTGTTKVGFVGALVSLRTLSVAPGGPIAEVAVDQPAAPLVKATVAPATAKETAPQPPSIMATPSAKGDTGCAAAHPQAVPTPWFSRPKRRHGALTDARAALGRLEADLLDADHRLARERLKLASRWHQLQVASQEAQYQATAIAAKGGKEAAEARTARDNAIAEVEAAAKRHGEVESRLKALEEEEAMRTCQLQQQEEDLKAREAELADHDSKPVKVEAEQATERGRLEVLQREVAEARAAHAKHVTEVEARLDAREKKILANADAKAAPDHAAFSCLELRACQALKSI
nr:uncharacterized protein LOC109772448 [Aegilops tauschii subsp. strangulata]